MNASSPTNTAGLENAGHIVWLKAGGVRYCPEGEPFTISESCRVEPLVTAASAQARIAELEAKFEAADLALAVTKMMVGDQERRAQAEEARADRLATLSTRLSTRLCDALERLYSTDPEWVKTEYPNGVSEKLVIDAALQDQPK